MHSTRDLLTDLLRAGELLTALSSSATGTLCVPETFEETIEHCLRELQKADYIVTQIGWCTLLCCKFQTYSPAEEQNFCLSLSLERAGSCKTAIDYNLIVHSL